jgi:murein DD-endopeptidase MepM/ murein hydrolase activator NlpD
MASSLLNYLNERYLGDIDINLETSILKAHDEYNENTIKSTHQKYQNLFYDERLISGAIRPSEQTLKTYYTPVNHTIFAQNVVNESKTGKLPKTAQLFIGSLGTASNNGQISPTQLAKLFRTSQGLIEVPIHLILYIGGLYDFYYYGTPDKDIDLSVINGLTNKEGVDILSDKLLLNKHYGSYAFSDSIDPGLKAATLPFVKPLTPRFIDDLMSFDYESYKDNSNVKNYADTYYDYEFNKQIPLSNNISSHIPFSGYGLLNNYLNSMSYLYFGEGLDGGSARTSNLNDDKIPYHIIGNFRGKLKTFKTYNDQNINFLGSYNSYGPGVKFELPTPESDLNTITSALTFDDDFIFTDKNSKEKIEFFLLLSKIKCNFIGGYIDTVDVYNIVRKLCTINNLKAKQDGIEIPDFITLLIHSLMPPDGPEPDNAFNRFNRNLNVLDKYVVDYRSFNGYIDIKTEEYTDLYQLIAMVINLTGDNLYDYFSRYLVSVWSREFNRKEKNRLKGLDSKGTFVVYPSCGGDIDIKNLFTPNDSDTNNLSSTVFLNQNYQYQKTNVVHTIFETQGDAYLKTLRYNDSSFVEYHNVSNDVLEKYNGDTKLLYSKINPGLFNFIDVNNNVDKFSGKSTIPLVNPTLDNSLINRFTPVYFRPENAPTNGKAINYFDRYDDVYLVANTTNPEAIKKLKFDNKSLIYNTSRLFWFDTPKYDNVITPETIKFAPKNQSDKPKLISVDYIEYAHFNLKNKSVYDYNQGEDFYDVNTGRSEILNYDQFKSGLNLYITNRVDHDSKDMVKLFSDQYQFQEQLTAKSLLDVFDVDKLEDFRALFRKFTDETQEGYFTRTFNTFDFKSLLKHTTMFGYSNLPNSLSLGGRSFGKDELLALLSGYSGAFIDFASNTGLSKLINTALTLGQEDKARFVIDEFLNAKITVNNYSTAGPLSIEGTDVNNPSGLRLNSFVFNPIVAYSSNTRSYENIVASLGDVLLFRTILFGDQIITSYSDANIDINNLIDKYVYFKGSTKSIDLDLDERFVIKEIARSFFRKLNIQLNENNLKLLITYLRSFISYTLSKSDVLNTVKEKSHYLFDIKKDTKNEDIIYPNKEGAVYSLYDYNKESQVIVTQIKNGVAEQTGNKITYKIKKFEDLSVDIRFNEWVKDFNKDFVEKTLTTLNGSLSNLAGKLDEILITNPGGTGYDAGDPFEAFEPIPKEEMEIRTGYYYRLKNLYDKNVSFIDTNAADDRLIKRDSRELANTDINAILNSPLFFNFNVQQQDICDDAGLLTESNEYLKDLIDYVSVVDRGNNAFGTKVFVDIVTLKQVLTDELFKAEEINKAAGKTMWTILSKLASDHEFLLMPMTSYINLSGSVAENQDPYDLAHDMFGVFKNLEMWESNPAFIFQLGSLTSNITTGNKVKKSANTNFDLSNTFCLDIDPNSLDVDGNGRILNEDAPADVRNSNVSSFIVDFANQNQNMFESIQLSTDEFANTEESIKAQVGLITNDQPILSSGKLFSAMENRSYSCTVTSLGNATIQPLSYFYLRNVPLFYGTYWITNVSHKITPNNMITTFKGVRQPIARKPTANVAIIKALIQKANQNSAQQGFLDRNDLTPIHTAGRIYIDRAFTGVSGGTSETKYGLLYQKGVESDKYVTYNALWIIASYLKLMTNGDTTDTVLIKTLISYLHNNASALAVDSQWDIGTTSTYFIDIVVYDLYHKLGYDAEPVLSLSSLLDSNPTTSGDVYQSMLIKILEFAGKPSELLTYLSLLAEELYNPKTTLITNSGGYKITNDASLPKITFPNQITEPIVDINTRVNYWVSDKTESNYDTFNGLSTYKLVNLFDTKPVTTLADTLAQQSINAVQRANVADATYVAPQNYYQPDIQKKLNEKLKLPDNQTQTTTDEDATATPRALGTKTDGTFIFGSAFSNKFTPTGYQGDDLVVYVAGAYGKSKQYSFFKICKDSEKFESDTIKLSLHSYINLKELGQDTGSTGDTKNADWTILLVGDDQVNNIYVAPTRGSGNALVAGWTNPLDNIFITDSFGYREWRGRVHEGLDLRAADGTNVYSPLDGVVISDSDQSSYGTTIIIAHDSVNLSTLYGHLSERKVKKGDVVTSGQLIAKSGHSGGDYAPHLHFEIMKKAVTDNVAYFDQQNQLLLTDPEPYVTGQVIFSGNGKVPTGPDSDFWKLVTICAGENYIDQPQGMADVAQSIYNRVNLQGGYGKTISEVIMAQGQYEPTFKTRALWEAIKDEETAIAAYMATKGVDREQAQQRIKTSLNAIKDPTLKANAASFVGSRTEFLAAAPTSSSAVGVVEREPKGKNNAFFWNYQGKTDYYNNNNLAATKIPGSVSQYV